jgi:hypothetical protein
MKTHRTLFTALVLLAVVLTGCGGGGGTPAGRRAGQVRFNIAWPERQTSRFIPQGAESIKLIAREKGDDDELILEKVVPRGERVVTLDLPSVEVTIEAQACANADGSGQVLAKGATTITVQEMQVASASLTMDSVITHVRFTPEKAELQEGSSLTVTASAMDANGAIVLTSPNAWEWQPENSHTTTVAGYRTFGGTITLRGKWGGSGAFLVKERETGKTARLPVTVAATDPVPPLPGNGPGLFITPDPLVLRAGETVRLQSFRRDEGGNVGPGHVTFSPGDANVALITRPGQSMPDELIGVAQGKGYIMAWDGGKPLTVPVEVKGHLLWVYISPGEGNAAEVSVDGQQLVYATPEGNELGRRITYGTGVYAIPVSIGPGKHTMRVKNVSTGPLPPGHQTDWLSFQATVAGGGFRDNPVQRGTYEEVEFTIP